MGADPAPSPRPSDEVREARSRRLWDGVVESARRRGEELSGHHHVNRVVPLSAEQAAALGRPAGTRVLVRHRKKNAPPVVVRTWTDEQAVLDAIGGTLGHVPRCLARRGDVAVHSYLEGTPLAGVCRDGKPVDSLLIDAFAGLLAGMTGVPEECLPPRPGPWPRDGDSRGFLRRLALAADEQILRPNWAAYGGLFVALGVPENGLRLSAHWAPKLTPRPFSLLHGDLHRANAIVSCGGAPPLRCVDWELATYGDPLHDLAVHLVRMRYPEEQWPEVVERWRAAMYRVRPAAVEGLDEDLRHYIDFEHAQSVFPDVIRAAGSLGDAFTRSDLEQASQEVHRALVVSRRQLRLRDVMDAATIEPLLFRWRVARGARRRDRSFAAAITWRRDERVPLRAPFAEAEVEAALWAEGAATAGQVFKGTAHLGTVVSAGAFADPVMVRRKVGTGSPIEPRFLAEHAVLRAIEDSAVGVRAPKVLALGVSDLGEPFTIHTYEGPPDTRVRPRHPVHGLLPGEAHDLVVQLGRLAQVDPWLLTQDMKGTGFYGWLCDRLVEMVAGLSPGSKELAARLGLPDAAGLGERLRRHEVHERPYVLLHGDLNPWNLVRGERGFGLTLIDWEMAMVGDPLYDLVRHIHLTPTTRETRERMYARWARLLPEPSTLGWADDVPVYRGMEIVRSAYVDLDRLVTGSGLDAPNVRRAVGSYTTTLHKALTWLGLVPGSGAAASPYLALALPHADRERGRPRAAPRPVPSSP